MKSIMSLLPLVALGLCAPHAAAPAADVAPGSVAPASFGVISSHFPSERSVDTDSSPDSASSPDSDSASSPDSDSASSPDSDSASSTESTPVTWDTKETHISTPVPGNSDEFIALLYRLHQDVRSHMQGLNETCEHEDDRDKVVGILGDVLRRVIVLCEDVVGILGRIVVGALFFTESEIARIVEIVGYIIGDILWTAAAIIYRLDLLPLVGEVLGLVGHCLVLLLTVLGTLVHGLFPLVFSLLGELGLLPLVRGIALVVFNLLSILKL